MHRAAAAPRKSHFLGRKQPEKPADSGGKSDHLCQGYDQKRIENRHCHKGKRIDKRVVEQAFSDYEEADQTDKIGCHKPFDSLDGTAEGII